jgi:flagellar basal-body rod modification protein FlgD
MTSPLTSTNALLGASSAGTSATTPSSSAASGALDQNSFLKLLMAQMENQDPTAPTDSTTFVTQLAQFTQVQQTTAQTTTLSNIQNQLQSLSSGQATNLVGKTVTVNGNSMTFNGTFASPANVTLAGAAQTVTVAVQDSQGNTVRTMNLGAASAGPLSITWDGKEDTGQSAPSGSYMAAVTAAGASGQTVGVSTTVTGTVTQVSLNNGSPTLTLSTGAVAPVSQLAGVVGSVGTSPTP